MKVGVRAKILITVVAVFLFATGLNTFVISRVFRKGYSAALQSKMDVIANTLKSQIERLTRLGIAVENIEGFEAQCQEVLHKHKELAYVMVAQTNGNIIFHNDPTYHNTTIKNPEILNALKQKQQTECLSKTNEQTYYNTVVLTGDDSSGQNIAVIVGFPTALIDNKIQELIHYSFIVALISLGIATFLLLTILSISVTKPLSRLIATIHQIRDSSNLDSRVIVRSADEIGELAVSFNEMVEDLNKTTVSRDSLMKEVDERKKVEERLRKTEEKYRMQFEGALDAIFIADAETGIIVDCNPAATRLVEREKSELIGQPHTTLHPSEDIQEGFSKTFKQHLEDKQGEALETQVITKNGEIKDVAIKANLLEVRGKKLLQGIFRDITEGKKAENRQSQLLEQLEKVNEELKEFAYVVSHDLKAPLRGIKTLVDWITSDYVDKLDDDGKEQMNLLVNRVDRMHNLIDGILQYSRIGRVAEEKVKVNFNELVSDVIDMLAPPENITITIENELPTIECEQIRMMQVFQNLLSNAVKYMDKSEGQIKVGCIEDDSFWNFSVSDNGPGIEDKYYDRIFQMFQTLSPRDEFESTGVGLTVVKKIVELYGGKIWIESKVGEGSTFFFALPKQETGVRNEKLETNIIS